MVVARLSRWLFKVGKRDGVFQELDSTFGDIERGAKGYRGVLSLLDKDDPNRGIVITLWSDEDSSRASETGVFESAIQKINAHLQEPPKVEEYGVFTAELKQLVPS